MSTNNKPVHKIRLGAIKAAVWENGTEKGTRHSVTISRVYRSNDEWKESSSFGRDHLLVVSKVLDMAHSWIHDAEQQSSQPER